MSNRGTAAALGTWTTYPERSAGGLPCGGGWEGSYTDLLTDHLGSVAAITDADGDLLDQQRYLPFGGVRPNVGSITQTDFGYTGQRNIASMGLMDYKARMYDPYLNRWTQPDTDVPARQGPQALNRYSYTLNNPVKFTDPTGHRAACGTLGDACDTEGDALHASLERFKEPQRVENDAMDVFPPEVGRLLAQGEIDLLRARDPRWGGWLAALQVNGVNAAAQAAAGRRVPAAALGNDGVLLNDPGDAYRHAYGSALLARRMGEDFATAFTTAHETEASGARDAREQSFMDLHNNEVGISIWRNNPNASDQQLQDLVFAQLESGGLYVWDGSDIYYSDQCPACTYH